jgi:murein DD-endopeptidase MepM/ murein hydrolase activator NlpD
MITKLLVSLLATALLALALATTTLGEAQSLPEPEQALEAPPFILPFADPPGPDTWLLVQTYGNTVMAYQHRDGMYSAGQGLHFGIDLAAPCGYPVLAIGDGVVVKVDEARHGAAPHNLMIDHSNGFASFYGHLLERPKLYVGQVVRAGQEVARVGDPDLTCSSRPHLHLEIRNAGSHNRAYNPVPLIAADWDGLALIGPVDPVFARDLEEPQRWQRLDDQPEVIFGGPRLNDYTQPWPPPWRP